MTRKIWIWTSAAAACVVVAGAGFAFFGQASEGLKIRRGDVIESIYGLGTVTADQIFHVRSGMNLMVQSLFVHEGDRVKPGDALVKLEDNTMRSTIDGIVTTVAYQAGELVTPQVSILTVTNLDKLFLEVSLEQQSVLRVKKDQSASVSFESLREDKYEATVTSIYPRDNQFIVTIEMKKWPKGLLPGMTADVAILIGQKENALLIPLKSIVGGQVTRIRDGKRERVPVKLGVIDGLWGEVTSQNILESDELLTRK